MSSTGHAGVERGCEIAKREAEKSSDTLGDVPEDGLLSPIFRDVKARRVGS